MRNKADACPGCGSHDDEWWDDKRRPVDPPPYEVKGHLCLVCKAMDEFKAQDQIKKSASGLHMRLRPYQDPEGP